MATRTDLPRLKLLTFPSHASCTSCELHQEAKNPGVPTGNYSQSVFPSPEIPYLIVVGMNPGWDDDQEGVASSASSPSGKMLRNVYLNSLMIEKTHTVYITNAARCSTPGDTQLKNSHIRKCWPHLQADIDAIMKWHHVGGDILCLGTHAAQTITKNMMGKALSVSKALEKQGAAIGEKTNFFVTYHPSGVLRTPRLKYAVAEHLQLIGQQLHGVVPSPSLPNIVPVRSPQ